MPESELGNPLSDRAYFERLIAERVCLERRKTHQLRESDYQIFAFRVAMNSHRFRRRGLDGKVWRLAHAHQE